MNIVEFKSHPSQTQDDIIALLEDRLVQARAGNIRGIAVAYIDKNGEAVTQASAEDMIKVLGAITVLTSRIMFHLNTETVKEGDK